jgi:hypothetical protein
VLWVSMGSRPLKPKVVTRGVFVRFRAIQN